MTDLNSISFDNPRPRKVDLFSEKQIQPASATEIKAQIDESYQFAANAKDYDYGRGRGVKQLLTIGQDYAELPGHDGETPRAIIESLPAGSKILDVGCGYGQLGAEILGTAKFKQESLPLNKMVEVYGFDAQSQPGQERLTKVVIGNIDNLLPKVFSENLDGFELIISSSVLYHLPDYWGGILRMANLLKPKGILLASTMPRVIYSGIMEDNIENAKGYLMHSDDGSLEYYRSRNVFDVNGNLLPPGQVVEILNRHNQNFRLQYGVAHAENLGNIYNGGQISGQRISSEGNLDLSNLFYCLSRQHLGYILTNSPSERTKFQNKGFINVQDRFQNKITNL
ncbi:MAG TPA: class I SAM-dependent methyltransferase [Candidatus Wunengus sp. YC60]|uniref:class I SAM-dependent methyltransferase n=1 Tax=Candidatus Wunengus sp. YC60 TaxID=3367697 RepID=UPI004029118C